MNGQPSHKVRALIGNGMFAVAVVLFGGCSASPSVTEGILGDSKIMIASPVRWNGDLLIFAHGYMPQSAKLSAFFDPNSEHCKGLPSGGWLVAATSYRRNGTIIREACEDIESLRLYLKEQYGKPRRTFVLGYSMGGAIGTMLAETCGSEYTGVVVVGAALGMRDANNPYQYTYRPKVPILFLANQSELKGPADYVARAGASERAVLWTVKRDGHCNVRDAETGAALDGLVNWAATGKIARDEDATIPADNLSSVATFRDGRAYATVTRVTSDFGNVYTQFVQADLARLDMTVGSRFKVGCGGKAFNVVLGKTYSDVPRGEWVGFLTAEGWLEIARNSDNAAKELGTNVGDVIWIAKVGEE